MLPFCQGTPAWHWKPSEQSSQSWFRAPVFHCQFSLEGKGYPNTRLFLIYSVMKLLHTKLLTLISHFYKGQLSEFRNVIQSREKHCLSNSTYLYSLHCTLLADWYTTKNIVFHGCHAYISLPLCCAELAWIYELDHYCVQILLWCERSDWWPFENVSLVQEFVLLLRNGHSWWHAVNAQRKIWSTPSFTPFCKWPSARGSIV